VLKRNTSRRRRNQRRRSHRTTAPGAAAAGEPEPKAQRNFTDPESRIMKGPAGFVQAYNAQAAVAPALQLIVGQALTQQANDKQQLIAMIERVREQAGQKMQEVLIDSGYCSDENLRQEANKKDNLYVATGKQKHHQPTPSSPRGRIPKSATRVERMKRKLMTRAGQAISVADVMCNPPPIKLRMSPSGTRCLVCPHRLFPSERHFNRRLHSGAGNPDIPLGGDGECYFDFVQAEVLERAFDRTHCVLDWSHQFVEERFRFHRTGLVPAQVQRNDLDSSMFFRAFPIRCNRPLSRDAAHWHDDFQLI